jgi:hypothetical protein
LHDAPAPQQLLLPLPHTAPPDGQPHPDGPQVLPLGQHTPPHSICPALQVAGCPATYITVALGVSPTVHPESVHMLPGRAEQHMPPPKCVPSQWIAVGSVQTWGMGWVQMQSPLMHPPMPGTSLRPQQPLPHSEPDEHVKMPHWPFGPHSLPAGQQTSPQSMSPLGQVAAVPPEPFPDGLP